jgi:CheY-like chemotaxis protein
MILDLQLPDMSGFNLLEAIDADTTITMPKVFIYSGCDLNDNDLARLAPFTEIIIIKDNDSAQQLLDEVRQFVSLVSVKPNEPSAQSMAEFSPLLPKKQLDKTTVDLSSFEHNSVLLVDDDMRNTFALAKVLRKYNLTVTIASSGRQCLDILAETPGIEMVLMDISMPKMDGFETMRRIRQQLAYDKLPLIAITANAMPEDKQKCIEAGANDYMAKPVDIEQLLTKITKWL